MRNRGLRICLLLPCVFCVTVTAQTALARQQPAVIPDIKAVDPAGLKAAVSAQKGKVVLVNLWATWCGPCVQEFPDIVKLYNAYKKKGLVVLAVSIDKPADWARVREFISAQRAGFPVLIPKGAVSTEEFVKKLDPTWRGAVPVTYIYNKQGKLAGKPLYGARDYDTFVAAIKPLLK